MNGPYVAAVSVTATSLFQSPYPTASWITYPHTCTVNPADHTCESYVNDYFRLMFTLPSTVCNNPVNTPNGYCLTMNFFADNCVNAIYVNGIASYTNPSPSTVAYDFLPGGGHTVTICDNWQSGTNTVVVHVLSSPPIIAFMAFITATATSPGGYTVATTQTNVSCYGAANASAAISLNGYSGPASYTWLPSGGNAASASNLGPGIYTVNVQLPLCSFNNTLSITQPATFAVGVSTTQTLCKGEKIKLTADGAETFSWVPGNLSGSSVTLSPIATTMYTVVGTNSVGCKSAKSFTLKVLPCTTLEENPEAKQPLQLLKNNAGYYYIKADNTTPEKGLLELIDMNGTTRYRATVSAQNETQLADLQPGIYILRFTGNTTLLIQRVLIE